MADVLEVNDDNFESEVLKNEKPALVDFWAPWCGPCRMMHPVIESLSEEYEGKAVIARCNVDDNQALAGRFNVTAIPTGWRAGTVTPSSSTPGSRSRR